MRLCSQTDNISQQHRTLEQSSSNTALIWPKTGWQPESVAHKTPTPLANYPSNYPQTIWPRLGAYVAPFETLRGPDRLFQHHRTPPWNGSALIPDLAGCQSVGHGVHFHSVLFWPCLALIWCSMTAGHILYVVFQHHRIARKERLTLI